MAKKRLGVRLFNWSTEHLRELMRISFGIIFFWFGALKVFDVSPVYDFVVTAYPIFALPYLFTILGAFEVVVGLCLLMGVLLKQAEILIFVHLMGTLLLFITDPHMAFAPFPILTFEGEFLLKNFVLGIGVLYLISHKK